MVKVRADWKDYFMKINAALVSLLSGATEYLMPNVDVYRVDAQIIETFRPE